MIWLNPWAWLGAAGVALPVLIHLLGRGHARVHKFPTLRFLDTSRLLPTRRTRIHDALLLAVRCGILVFAAAAMAQPLWLTANRRRSADRGLARAIVVDTSASMRRDAANGVSAVDSARREARTLAAGAQTSVTIESNDPSRALRSASNWLVRQGRRSELVILSDFQRGQIDSSDFAVIPKGIGLTLRRIPTVTSSRVESRAAAGGIQVVAHATLTDNRTDAEWLPAGVGATNDAVVLLGAESDHAALNATRDAAATIATPLPIDSARGVAIVFPRYADRDALGSSAKPLYTSWMVDLLATLEADSLAVAASGVATIAGRPRLVLVAEAEPGSFASARMATIANRAMSVAPPVGELEPETLSDAELVALQRPASDDASQLRPSDDNGPSDGRWLWLVALALLLIEAPLRRSKMARSPAPAEDRARAA